MATVENLIAALDSPSPDTRLEAAKALRDHTPAPVAAIPALIAHLTDEGSVDEQWTDWNGAVVGGTTHHVSSYALDALVHIGTPAFAPLLATVERGGVGADVLGRFVAGLPIDALLAAGIEVIERASRLLHEVSPSQLLSWAKEEHARGERRVEVLGRRLQLAIGDTAKLAATELGTVSAEDAPRAAVLLAERVLGDLAGTHGVQSAAAAALDRLGPVLAPGLAARLVEAAPTRAMFSCWPSLLPAVAQYAGAEVLGPWLLAWVREDKAPMSIGVEHHRNVRGAAARAIARLGERARPLHDELIEMYAAATDERRGLALTALPDRSVIVERMGARWREVLASSTSRSELTHVLQAIGDLGPAGAPLVDAMLPFVEGPRGYYKATLAVGAYGEAGRVAVPALIRALAQPALKTWACFALRDLGRENAAPAMAALEELARAGDRDAKLALERINAPPRRPA